MLLLIPGPVTTRPEVKAAMAQDIAPWDNDTRPHYVAIRARLLAIGHADPATHAALPLQGCGHFITEAAIRTFLPPAGRILIPSTGPYADRMTRLATESGRAVVGMPVSPMEPTRPDAVAVALAADPTISHVGLVYSETGSGIVHDVAAVGAAVRAAGRRMIVDAVSAFGALPLDLSAQPEIDAAVFTANKCLEGLPGLAFALARCDRLLQSAGNAASWSFDLADIYQHTLKHFAGSFRFTPPIQVVFAFEKALELFATDGGQPARLARYRANMRTVYDGMLSIGLRPYLPREVQGPVVLNVHAPDDPAWLLQPFVDALKDEGFLISNFFDTPTPSFRVGLIGAITPDDMRNFIGAVDTALHRLGVRNRAPSRQAA
jgi:2-aminoethylphosphonate-pyruvate transaminase